MAKTSRKSVSQAAPKKKLTASTKGAVTTTKKSAVTQKRTRVTSAKSQLAKKTSTATKKKPITKRKAETTKKPATKTKATTTKQPTRKAAPKKTTTTKTAKTKSQKRETEPKFQVTLPTRMSIRAREKALVLADTFEKDFYSTGVTLAKVSGLAFLLIGSLVTLTQLAEVPMIGDVCDGQLCHAAQVSSAVSTGSDEPAEQHNYVELLTDIPDVIESPIGIAMQFSSAQDTNVYVRHLTETGYTETELTTVSIGNDKYEATIDPTQLTPDQYEMMVSVQHVNITTPTVYTLGYFAIIKNTDATTETDLATTTDDSSQNEETPVADVSPIDDETESEATSVPAEDTTDSPDNTEAAAGGVSHKESIELVSISDKRASEEDTEPVTTLPVTEDDEPVVKESEAAMNPLQITANNTLSGLAEISIRSTWHTDAISFFIRPTQTLNTQSVGQSISGMNTFRFDTRQFPDGEYQLYAEGRQEQSIVTSNTVEFMVENALVRTPEESVTVGSGRELLRISEVVQNQAGADADAEQESTLDSSNTDPIDFNKQDRVRAILASNPEILDELFQRYAVAQQPGDPALINEAVKAIESYQERLLSSALNDERDRLFAKELELGLENEFNKLMQNVQTFEAIRKDRSENDSAIDTDGDGISDFDEITLYKTDPDQADSDNDGFTDGAEIIKGFNPNDAAAEAAIVYQSPKDSVGVVITEKLQVSDVQPEIKLSANDGVSNVRAVVTGTGLPNSFVTLYIFSEPTIVTVRTEADGTFEYTFTKGLEDGEHEVFIALTDNAGEIVAQSDPFTFIKEAQAFTPVDAQEASSTLVTPDTVSDFSPYRIVLGMSVFALGILLILLGVGLRVNKSDAVILQDTPA